jgi:ADP-ribosylglycohydrolase
MGGLEKLMIEPETFPVSDDTVMHIATAKAITKWDTKKKVTFFLPLANHWKDMKELCDLFCKEYVICWSRMYGR